MKTIGPIKIIGPEVQGEITVPLATYESPLWPSTHRGACVSCLTAGIHAVVLQDCMTRSVLVEAPNAEYAQQVLNHLALQEATLASIVSETSRFATFQDYHGQVIGNLLYLRFS